MSSFESELAALVERWLERGDSQTSMIDALVYEVAKIGPANLSVPGIVMESMERASARYEAADGAL